MYTLQGKTRPTWHIRFSHQSTYVRRTLPTGGPHTWQHFTSHQQSWIESLLSRKRAPDTIHSMPTNRSAGPYPVSLPSQLMKQWDRYVQYLLMGANRIVLNWHMRGLQPWRCRLSTYHSLIFPISCLPFPLVAPPGLHFYQAPWIKPQCWVLKNLWPPRGLSTTRPSIRAYIYA
jgi:hypothetical protein